MARIGGAFPFSPTGVQYGGGFVTLVSGGVFYPPAGFYLWTPGATTVLQTFDPIQGQWRSLSDPTGSTSTFDCDGYNWRFLNASGTVSGALITNAGSGATNGIGSAATGVSISFAAPGAPGVTATAYPIVGGAVAAPTVNTVGSGFLVPPTILIDPPPFGGVQATAIATLTAVGGGISSITMVNPGAGYTGVPNFYILPQPNPYPGAIVAGVAAGLLPPPGVVNPTNQVPTVNPLYFGPQTSGTASAQLNAATLTGSGTLTGLGMITPGGNYAGTTIPGITIAGCGAAAATPIMNFAWTGISGLTAGSGYTGNAPIVLLSEGIISGATGQFNNYDLGAGGAQGAATIAAGGVTGVVIEDSGFGLQKVPTLSFINTGSIATGIATATAVVGGAVDTITLQSQVN